MNSLTLEEKVGQLFMFGFPGKDPAGAKELVQDLKAGGIIYFARNTGKVEDVATISTTLQTFALESGSGVPLFISADQEGGNVARLTEGLPVMPGPMSLAAAADSPRLVEEVSRATAIQLRAAGINMNLAPVLDVNDNPDNPIIGVRSFGQDPQLVARLGCAAIRGLLSRGVIPVGKHFPGHGNTSVDSHLDLPLLPHPRERLDSVELVPFKTAIRQGIPAIMSAHIVFAAIDPARPATLSPAVLQGLLRHELGFQGIIMTDCLEMNAIAKGVGTVDGAVQAFKAGCDMLLISHTRELQRKAYETVLEAVRSGDISMERLDESVNRILKLKKEMGLPNPLEPHLANSPEFQNLSREAHRRSITLIKNDQKLVRLVDSATQDLMALSVLIVSPKSTKSLPVEDSLDFRPPASGLTPPCLSLTGKAIARFKTLKTALGRSLFLQWTASGKPFVSLRIHEVFMEEEGSLEKCASLARKVRATVILARNAKKDPEQARFIKALVQQAPEAILVATQDPYDSEVVPDINTYICTYSSRPEAMEALAEVLLGKCEAEGHLPVTMTVPVRE